MEDGAARPSCSREPLCGFAASCSRVSSNYNLHRKKKQDARIGHPVNDNSEDVIQYARILQIPQPRVMRTVVIEGLDGVPVTVSPNLSPDVRYVVIGDLSFYDVAEYTVMRKEVEDICVKNARPRAYFLDGGELCDYFTLNYASFDDNSVLYPTVPSIWIVDSAGRHTCRAFTPNFRPATLEDLEDLDDDDSHTD